MARPGWEKLWANVIAGKVDRIVVWRLDRLGRTVSGLSMLFEELINRKVPLVSIKDSLDLATAAGAHGPCARFGCRLRNRNPSGTPIRRDRRAKKGRKALGWEEAWNENPAVPGEGSGCKEWRKSAKPIAGIARVLEVSRQTVYRTLGKWERQPARE